MVELHDRQTCSAAKKAHAISTAVNEAYRLMLPPLSPGIAYFKKSTTQEEPLWPLHVACCMLTQHGQRGHTYVYVCDPLPPSKHLCLWLTGEGMVDSSKIQTQIGSILPAGGCDGMTVLHKQDTLEQVKDWDAHQERSLESLLRD